MPKKNPLIGLVYSPKEYWPVGQVYPAGLKWKPAPLPNGKKVPVAGQKKGK